MKSILVTANNFNDILSFCKDVLEDAGFENVYINKTDNSVFAETGISFYSFFGENIQLKVTSTGANNYRISIFSESTSSFQIIDWGKNEDNIDKILLTLKSRLGQ